MRRQTLKCKYEQIIKLCNLLRSKTPDLAQSRDHDKGNQIASFIEGKWLHSFKPFNHFMFGQFVLVSEGKAAPFAATE